MWCVVKIPNIKALFCDRQISFAKKGGRIFCLLYSVTFYDLSVERLVVQTPSNICRKNEMFYNLRN